MEVYYNTMQGANNTFLQRINPQSGFIGQPQPMNINQHIKILTQMNNSVCKIVNGIKTGTGFLCLIPFPNIEYRLKVLITCNHVFNEITIGNKIKVKFANGIQGEIIIDGSRRVYTSNPQQYDITMIELKDREFNKSYYLSIDDDLFLKDRIQINQQIYIIHYPNYPNGIPVFNNGEEVTSNNGTIKNKVENKIMYHLTTYEGSSGAPIFNLYNFNVIGIHRGNINS